MRVKMSKFFWNSLCISPAVLGAALVVSSSALAADNQPTSETLGTQAAQAKTAVNQSDAVVSTTATSLKPFEASPKQAQLILPKSPAVVAQAAPAGQDPSTLQQLNEYSSEGAANAEGQVTSVSQLSDVQPTDWAFQALQSLVERYGCIAGYPDGTFKGNRAMTRYEFAAGLNACLDKVSELIASSTANLVTREDLAAVQRLQEEFAAELAALRGRVDALEARTSELEANQFSTTTKLTGEAIFGVAANLSNGKVGPVNFKTLGSSNPNQNQAVFQDRVRLNLNTSFTGRDLLVTRLQAGNGTPFSYGRTSSGTLNWQNVTPDNTFRLDTLAYKFPVGDRLNVTLAANAGTWDDIMPTVNPYFDDADGGNGAITLFGQRNPIYRLGGGAGAGINYAFGGKGLLGGIFGPTSFSLGYLAATAGNPTQGNGLFNGDQSTMAQLTFTPAPSFQFALAYNHSYFGRGNWGYDNGAATGAGVLGGYTGTGYANSLGDAFFGPIQSKGRKVVSDSYAFNMSWRVTPGFVFGGFVTYGNGRVIGLTDAKLWTYATTLAFPDLGKPGNLLGFVFGREPYLSSITANSFSLGGKNTVASWHLEAFYKLQLTDNISITPGVVWITSPNQNKNDSDIVTGTIRTTFTF
jgi:hypothetical protein